MTESLNNLKRTLKVFAKDFGTQMDAAFASHFGNDVSISDGDITFTYIPPEHVTVCMFKGVPFAQVHNDGTVYG